MNEVGSSALKSVLKTVGYNLPLGVRRRLLYARAHHRPGHLRKPVLFSEKVNWRILNDRRDLLSWTCDKLRMKDFASRTVGQSVRVPRTLWSGRNVSSLAEEPLDCRWVLKPNHLSGPVLFGSGPVEDAERLRQQTADWLRGDHFDQLGEWAYGHAEQTMLAEEHIGTADVAPDDYKFFVFGGKPVCVQVDSGRFSDHRRRFYDTNWHPLDLLNMYPLGPVLPRPENLECMLSAAAELGAPFDFMRVDLYDAGGEVWFGELTPYPGGGLETFSPDRWDRWLGNHWSLPDL